MSNDKDKGGLSVLFSKCIKIIANGALVVFLLGTILCCRVERYIAAVPLVSCFLKEWKTVFFAASVCVWGFTLTCVMFMLGRLEDVYYGTSLKRIVIMCFGKLTVSLYVILYIMLIPLMLISYYKKMWFVNAWFQVMNYAYSGGMILFISIISVRNTVIELIRDRTLRQMRSKSFNRYTYNDERLAVMNMIRNLDYDNAWQLNRLQSIVVDMIGVAIEKNRLYVMYNVIQLIMQYAGYETKEERKRIINILNDINGDVLANKLKKGFGDKKLREAVTTIILPILQLEVQTVDGKWISQLIGKLPWRMQRDVGIQLIFGAEYLDDCGTFCEVTVNELLETNVKLMAAKAPYAAEKLADEIRECWLNLNVYNHQGVKNEELYKKFIDDYMGIETLETRLCTTKLLRTLQTIKFEKTER